MLHASLVVGARLLAQASTLSAIPASRANCNVLVTLVPATKMAAKHARRLSSIARSHYPTKAELIATKTI